ncbi:GLIPR1-like protein 1 [Polymixia lowei]
MGSTVEQVLWTWILLCSCSQREVPGVCSVSLPEISDRKFIDDCVQTHNKARSSVQPPASDMLYMTWDEGLAVTARAWARNCDFRHNVHLRDVRRMHPTFPSVGENIWAGHPASSFTVKSAVDLWVGENKSYAYRENRCSRVCGHYTQVVWAGSYKVGCSVQFCPNGVDETSFNNKEGAIFVCNYAPAGNVAGRSPYQTGPPCSGCKTECVEKLCRSEDRDAQRSYNWSPDWDPALSTCGPSCVTVLVLRPLVLLGTFIAAYGVQRRYPNVFCYE